MNQTHLKEIIKALLETGKLTHYTKNDIETAIIKARGIDKRTIFAWSNALWKLGYIHQPNPGQYELNLALIEKLDINEAIISQMDSGSYGKNK